MKSSPLIGLFAIVLLAYGIWQSARLAHLEMNGMRSEGRIVRFEEKWSATASGHSSYDPIVKFRTHDNRDVEFEDTIGKYLPMYLHGSNVTVLYAADDPRGSAMIDLGLFLNWSIPASTLLAGLFATGMTLMRLRGGSERPTDDDLAQSESL